MIDVPELVFQALGFSPTHRYAVTNISYPLYPLHPCKLRRFRRNHAFPLLGLTLRHPAYPAVDKDRTRNFTFQTGLRVSARNDEIAASPAYELGVPRNDTFGLWTLDFGLFLPLMSRYYRRCINPQYRSGREGDKLFVPSLPLTHSYRRSSFEHYPTHQVELTK